MTSQDTFDSLLLVSFGGPEGPDDVIPFLENVLRGKNVPRERLEEVAEHYNHFGGVSPINDHCRELMAELETALRENGIELPIYWGNRNWTPFLDQTLQQMKSDGSKKALAFFTSAYSCYSGCRQYRENIENAQETVGTGAPEVHKLRFFYNHPLFIDAIADRVSDELDQIPESRRSGTRLLFTAHSIPESMAVGCNYVSQLNEASQWVASRLGEYRWELVYQSRSGPPHQPWLEPDICDRLEAIGQEDVQDVVIVPIGFLSDHMEVLFDLDIEAKEKCEALGISMKRAKAVGNHPKFIEMICELIQERRCGAERRFVGEMGASHDVCPVDCCLPGTKGRPVSTARK